MTGPSGVELHGVRPPLLPVRGVARLIDLGVYLGIMELAGVVGRYVPFRGLVSLDEVWLIGVELMVGVFAAVLYPMLSEGWGGATLGHWLTGSRVVRVEDLGPIDLRAAFRRSALFFVDAAPFGLVAYSFIMRSALAQRLGDTVAGTRVVRAGDLAHAPASAARGWAAGIVVAWAMVVLSYVVA